MASSGLSISTPSVTSSISRDGRDAVLGQHVGDELDQRRIAHLHRREIDRHVEAGPAPGVGKRAAQHEFAEPLHQPASARRPATNCIGGMAPRTGWVQRSSASAPTMRLPSADDDRLVMHVERLVRRAPAAAPFRGSGGRRTRRPSPARNARRCRAASSWRRGARGRRGASARRGLCASRGACAQARRDADLHRLLAIQNGRASALGQRRHRGFGGRQHPARIITTANSSPSKRPQNARGRQHVFDARGEARSAVRRRCDGRARR